MNTMPKEYTKTQLGTRPKSRSVTLAQNVLVGESESSSPRQSKVGQYIERMKAHQELSRETRAHDQSHDLALSLDDLYLGKADTSVEYQLSPETTRKELRKSLRILKEKDMVILSLRETCQDLSLKFANAENTIDEMRFKGQRSIRKSQSEMHLGPKAEKGTKDQATETAVDVLSESCSSWMEKVKYWKTDSTFLTSADADSGFRGSDLAEHEVGPSRYYRKRTAVQISPLVVPAQPITAQKSDEPTNQTKVRPFPSPPRRSRSQTNLHWQPTMVDKTGVTFNQFESLDKLLDDAMTQARRVNKKSKRLSLLLQSVDKKV